jgi:hypothetical protein
MGPKNGRFIRQINNIRIYYQDWAEPGREYMAIAPGRHVMEDFGTEAAAVEWCENTFDWVKRPRKKIATIGA